MQTRTTGSLGLMKEGKPQPRALIDLQTDRHRYMAVRKGKGQKEIIQEFWNNVEGTIEVGV